MANEETTHRVKLPLYDLRPRIENCWVAPNSTIGKLPPFSIVRLGHCFLILFYFSIVGEVYLKRWASVWYNSVVRGDINRVTVGHFTSIGDNCVIHTAAALPTGMSAAVEIGNNCTIGSGCTIYSCHIEDDVFIGDKCVILEGARIEKGA